MHVKEDKPKKEKLSRKQFLGIAWLTSIFALIGESLAALFTFIQPTNTGGFGGIVRAGTVEEFPPGTVHQIQTGRFYIYRLDDGSFLALWQRCTHLGCSVPWDPEQDIFHCPCHGSLFNKTGEVLGGPAPRPLDIFPVEIVDGQVLVDTGNPIQRAKFEPDQVTRV